MQVGGEPTQAGLVGWCEARLATRPRPLVTGQPAVAIDPITEAAHSSGELVG